MNRTQILSKLHKLLGKTAAYRVDDKAPDADEREHLRSGHKAAREEADTAEQARAQRLDYLLKGDAEYLRLKAAAVTLRERADRIASQSNRYRITVVTQGGVFNTVQAQGDTWAEVLAKLEKK